MNTSGPRWEAVLHDLEGRLAALDAALDAGDDDLTQAIAYDGFEPPVGLPVLPPALRVRAAAVVEHTEAVRARVELRRDVIGRALATVRRLSVEGPGTARFVDRTA